MKGFLLGFLKALKLPVKLLKRKQRTKRDEKEKKLRAYVRNFDPGRVKNRSWRKSDRKDKKQTKRRKKEKFSNNSKG